MNILDKYKAKREKSYPKEVTRFLKTKEKSYKKSGKVCNGWSFVGTFENYYNEIMINVIAYRLQQDKEQGKFIESTQVLIACPKFDYRWVQDAYCTMFGYKVKKDYYPYGTAANNLFKLDDCRVNWLNEINLPKYKYSCYKEVEGSISNYLQFYEKYPSTEKLIKTGFDESIIMSKAINKMVIEEKPFLKFMVRNKYYINWEFMGYDRATVPTIIKSFKKKIPLKRLVEEENRNKSIKYMNKHFYKNIYKKYPKIKTLTDKKHRIRAVSHDNDLSLYVDYMTACLELELDLTDSKVYNPKDFQRMHDLRIDQLENKRLRARRNESKEKNKQRIKEKIGYDLKIKELSKDYIKMEYENKDYKIIVAKNMRDFYTEAKALQHCLYSMAYYKKVAEERDIIFFVRKKDKIDDPFVTVEYDHKNNGIVQSYGYRDSQPDNEVQTFLHEWEKRTQERVNN